MTSSGYLWMLSKVVTFPTPISDRVNSLNLRLGHLGTLKLVIPWRNFNNPLEATVEDLFLLVKPAAASKVRRSTLGTI